MEIKKINENQVKFILSKSDLDEREIKISELAYGSEKAQELFREMMLQAMIKCDFQTDNSPVMVEAIPTSLESIIIIVTKVTGSDDLENKFKYFANNKDETRNTDDDDRVFLNGNDDMDSNKTENDLSRPYLAKVLIYSFDNLDELTDLSNRIFKSNLEVKNSNVYKYEDRFYMVIEKSFSSNKNNDENLKSILSEYGQKHISTDLSKYFLIEHGELFINNKAIEKLSKYLS